MTTTDTNFVATGPGQIGFEAVGDFSTAAIVAESTSGYGVFAGVNGTAVSNDIAAGQVWISTSNTRAINSCGSRPLFTSAWINIIWLRKIMMSKHGNRH
jgi:hypothetical protein